MRLGAMLADVVGGLAKEPVTERYPYERQDAPARLRGKLLWNRESCTGCGLCAKDCPADALEVIVIDRKAKQFVVRYHVDRCTFCAQCVASCRQGAMQMSNEEWELAALGKQDFTINYGEEADVQAVLEGTVPAKPEKPAKAKS